MIPSVDIDPEVKVQLIAVYARVVNEADGDLDSEKLFDQGYHILAPIIKLLDACSNIPSILVSFEELLEPLIKDICSRDTEPLFEQVPASDTDALRLRLIPDDLCREPVLNELCTMFQLRASKVCSPLSHILLQLQT
jgi:hypothetical protein